MLGRYNVRRTWAAVAAAIVSVSLLSGCATSSEQLAEQWIDGEDTGFISGDGSVESIPVSQRGEPVTFSGPATDGETREWGEYLGEVVVVNFWYAGCPPCRAEAPDLVEVANAYANQGVRFLGVNTRDDAAQARMFEQEFAVPYPSLLDTQNAAAVQRAFAGSVPLNAVPTTLVLDREGRVAHRILGQLTDASILETMINETLAEAG